MAVIIRPVTTIAECRLIEQLQIDIWGSKEMEVAPDHLLLTIAKEGGIVLLALDEEERAVGFAYGFPGLTNSNRLKLASHQVGVLPTYQNQEVGYELKLAQRQAALARHLDLITWTYDPLEGRNARFNLAKLGAVSNTYFRSLYGEMRDELNRGLPTDRFRVDWWIKAGHVVERLSAGQIEPGLSPAVSPIINPATILNSGLPVPAATVNFPESQFCLVEIPTDIQRLKAEAPDLALKWRMQTRHIFETVFAGGYTAIDLLRHSDRNYYLLQKDWRPDIESKGKEIES